MQPFSLSLTSPPPPHAQVVKMLEELLDDEDELRELNLSSRPRREMRREQRERARLERELERWGAGLVLY
jgi:hypothetical protein